MPLILGTRYDTTVAVGVLRCHRCSALVTEDTAVPHSVEHKPAKLPYCLSPEQWDALVRSATCSP